jgi:CheY-like chemotaxis protein
MTPLLIRHFLRQIGSSVVENCRVLIIYGSPLFADVISRLLEEDRMVIVAKINNLAEAQTVLAHHQVDVLIIDHDDPQLQEPAVLAQLWGNGIERLAIFLEMTGNQMIVHHQKRIENVTPTDLRQAIRSTFSNRSAD